MRSIFLLIIFFLITFIFYPVNYVSAKSYQPVCQNSTDACTLLEKPNYPLVGTIFDANEFHPTQEDMGIIAKNFDVIYEHNWLNRGEKEQIKALNPDLKFIRYLGIWATRPEDIRYAEQNLRRRILYFRAARLTQPIDQTETTFVLSPVLSSNKIPLLASNIDGIYSNNDWNNPSTDHFVTWIRIDNELMKIIDFNSTTNQLTVLRNFDGENTSNHAANANVFSPIYGNYPNLDYQGKSSYFKHLQYQYDPQYNDRWELTAQLLDEAVASSGDDGVFLDILMNYTFDPRNMLGEPMRYWLAEERAWDFQNNTVYDFSEFRRRQEIGVAFVQNNFYQKYGKWPIIYGNNMLASDYQTGAVLKKYLLSTPEKPRPVDSMMIENTWGIFPSGSYNNFYQTGVITPLNRVAIDNSGTEFSYLNWKDNQEIFMDATQNHLMPLVTAMNGGNETKMFEVFNQTDRHDAETWAFANYLLGVEVANDGTIYGQTTTPLVTVEGGVRSGFIDPIYLLPIGKPLETRQGDLEGYKMGNNIYAREFTNGIILVNPSREAETVTLQTAYIDPDTGNRSNIITLQSLTGKILLVNFTITNQELSACRRADINKDGVVNIIDRTLLLADFFKTVPMNNATDINKDGIIDVEDYSLMVSNFTQTSSCP